MVEWFGVSIVRLLIFRQVGWVVVLARSGWLVGLGIRSRVCEPVSVVAPSFPHPKKNFTIRKGIPRGGREG